MNDLQIFDYGDTPVRTVLQDGEPWWVLTDVCRVLSIERADSAARRLDPDEKGTHSVSTPGGTQNMTIINESGLYAVILRSDKPEAKPFRRWVTHEVLPSIRRTGTYSVTDNSDITRSRNSLSMSQIKEIMSRISCFDYKGVQIRTVTHGGQPWLVFADVCRALDYKNPNNLNRRIRPDEKCRLDIGLRNTLVVCINADGLDRVALFSRKETARDFRDWVASTIYRGCTQE